MFATSPSAAGLTMRDAEASRAAAIRIAITSCIRRRGG
jgi:hypothetical protein